MVTNSFVVIVLNSLFIAYPTEEVHVGTSQRSISNLCYVIL